MSIRIRKQGSNAFADRVASFSEDMRATSDRAKSMFDGVGHPSADLEQDPDALRNALEVLRLQHEELVVAEEELRAQVDELARLSGQLEAERERYFDLFDAAPDAYLVTNRSCVILAANSAAVDLFNLELRFLISKPLSVFLSSGEIGALDKAIDHLDRASTPHAEAVSFTVTPRHDARHSDARAKTKDDVHVSAHVSLTSRGERLLWLLRPAEDVSGVSPLVPTRRALEEIDAQLKFEQELRAELERESRAKDQFIAVLSHDLRAPLNAILGWTQLLRSEALDETARGKAFGTIERNARVQADLIEQLLDISRMAADRIQLELEPVDVGALVTRLVESALPAAKDEGLVIHYEIDPDITVIADRRRLEQVLSNLISNAIKYGSPLSEPTSSVASKSRIDVTAKRDDGYVRIEVRDTGRGIKPELLPHIFDLYKQGDRYASSRSGLGLGLYIVKRLVEMQDGTVTAMSDGEGAGASFIARFPIRDEMMAAAVPSEHSIEPPLSLTQLTALVVDDDEDSRDLMATILTRAGARVVCAEDADEALTMLATSNPDVFLSDVAMPGMDGWELVRRVREKAPFVATIAVSGFTTEKDTKRSHAAGYDLHIGKPIDAKMLVEAVHEAAELRRLKKTH